MIMEYLAGKTFVVANKTSECLQNMLVGRLIGKTPDFEFGDLVVRIHPHQPKGARNEAENECYRRFQKSQ